MTRQQLLTEYYYSWDTRLRGWLTFDVPVEIEPEFIPFIPPEVLPEQKRFGFLKQKKKEEEEFFEDVFEDNSESSLEAIEVVIEKTSETDIEELLFVLSLLSQSTGPITFEVMGTSEDITIRFVCDHTSSLEVLTLLSKHFPTYSFKRSVPNIPFSDFSDIGIIDFGLSDEAVLPLESLSQSKRETLLSFLSILDTLEEDELVLFQVSFQAFQNPWTQQLVNANTLSDGSSIFGNAPEFREYLEQKLRSPLVFSRVRLVVKSHTPEHSEYLAQRCIKTLMTTTNHGLNSLIPLSNVGIEYEEHVIDVVTRKSHRTGFLISLDELAQFVHFPKPLGQISKLWKADRKTVPLPNILRTGNYIIGRHDHNGQRSKVLLTDEARLRHTHILGSTGVGKSTFIVSLALEDARAGNGFSVFDPHGDLVEDILTLLPKERLKDVILFDPSDTEYPVGINLLQAQSEAERIVLSSDLVSVFKDNATSWGDTMTNVLTMAISAFLELKDTGTLIELHFFLKDEDYRTEILQKVHDPIVRHFWTHEFPELRKGSISPILTRLGTFLGPKTIRHLMAIKEGVDFNVVLSDKKIFLAKLSHGQIGQDNSHLLGKLLLSKHYQAALARQGISNSNRSPHYIYIDEFHNFLSSSLPGILTGIRKYGLGLIMAHQNLAQLNRETGLKEILLANSYVRVVFRLGSEDAKTICRSSRNFEEVDYQDLSTGEAILRVGEVENECNLTTLPPALLGMRQEDNIDQARNLTREKYSVPVAKVQQIILDFYGLTERPIVVKEDNVRTEVVKESSGLVEHTEIPELTDFEKSKEEFHQGQVEQKETSKHRIIQEKLRSLASSCGWRAEIEKEIASGRADILLTNESLKVGVEVSVSNSEKYELGNIVKCLEGGCDKVFLVSPDKEKRKRLEEKIIKKFTDKDNIQVVSEEEFTEWLMSEVKPKVEEQIVAGYRVKVNYDDIKMDENKQNSLRRTVLESLMNRKE